MEKSQEDPEDSKMATSDVQPEVHETTTSEDQSEADTLDLGDLSQLDGAGRNVLYEKGKVYQQKGNSQLALQCFIGCIKDIQHNSGFLYLPQCLRAIADSYYAMEDYTKAVQFIQAEKMYYETALVDTQELQNKIAENQQSETEQDDIKGQSDEALKAIEYENLARLCLDKEQPVLALEYSAKATKLRQQVYGDNHPVTLSSLDLFTTMYAEVGKHQYKETLKKVGDKAYTVPTSQSGSQGHQQGESGLRQRKVAFSSSKPETSDVSEATSEERSRRNEQHTHRVQRGNQSYPWTFYLWLAPFALVLAIACGVLVYDVYLIVTHK